MSALFDHEHTPRRQPHDVEDDTAEIPVPASDDAQDSGHGYDPPASRRAGRLRPTTRTWRLNPSLLLVAYASASLGSAWLLVLALLRVNLIVVVLMTAAVVWFVPDTVRLARWMRHLDDSAKPPRLSLSQNLIASVLAAVYAYLFADWLLHP